MPGEPDLRRRTATACRASASGATPSREPASSGARARCRTPCAVARRLSERADCRSASPRGRSRSAACAASSRAVPCSPSAFATGRPERDRAPACDAARSSRRDPAPRRGRGPGRRPRRPSTLAVRPPEVEKKKRRRDLAPVDERPGRRSRSPRPSSSAPPPRCRRRPGCARRRRGRTAPRLAHRERVRAGDDGLRLAAPRRASRAAPRRARRPRGTASSPTVLIARELALARRRPRACRGSGLPSSASGARPGLNDERAGERRRPPPPRPA